MTNNNQMYRMCDTLFESGPLRLNFILNLAWTFPENEMYEERTIHYWGEYRTKSRPSNANVLVKRKLDHYMTLEVRDYKTNMEDSIFIPNDIFYKFASSLKYASDTLFSRGQNVFVVENDHIRMNSSLPVVVDSYPKNKIFKILPTIINHTNYQQPGATLIVGNVDCMIDLTSTEFDYLANMLDSFNCTMYASTMLAALGPLEGATSAPMERMQELKQQQHNVVRKGRTFAGNKKDII